MGVSNLKGQEAADCARALEMLKPSGMSIIEAVAHALKSNRGMSSSITVDKATAALLTERELNGVGAKYLYNLRRALHRFADKFGERRLADLDGPMIKGFLDGLGCKRGRLTVPVTARTRNNYRAAIGQVFEHAKFQKWLPKDHESIEHLGKYKEAPKPTQIFTPAEMDTLLTLAQAKRASSQLVPFLAIGAFAGIRHAEITRLDWKDVSLAGGHITVQAANAKTAARRIVPIPENLARWLADYAKDFGPVCNQKGNAMGDALDRFAHTARVKKTGFVWKRNALRHSYISYRLAETNDTARVALEAGNSPAMIFRHYRELVSADAAKAWFAVQPAQRKTIDITKQLLENY
jgi:integrase